MGTQSTKLSLHKVRAAALIVDSSLLLLLLAADALPSFSASQTLTAFSLSLSPANIHLSSQAYLQYTNLSSLLNHHTIILPNYIIIHLLTAGAKSACPCAPVAELGAARHRDTAHRTSHIAHHHPRPPIAPTPLHLRYQPIPASRPPRDTQLNHIHHTIPTNNPYSSTSTRPHRT